MFSFVTFLTDVSSQGRRGTFGIAAAANLPGATRPSVPTSVGPLHAAENSRTSGLQVRELPLCSHRFCVSDHLA
jgi:hypothetical protein